MENKKKAIFGLIVVILVGAVIGFQLLKEESPPKDTAPRMYNKFSLSFSSPPELNKPVELTFEVTSNSYFTTTNNTIVKIVLPKGFEHVSGDLEWGGTLSGNQTVQLKAIVKSVKTGTWKIKGGVNRNNYSTSYRSLYVSVSGRGVSVSKKPPFGWAPAGGALKRVE